MTSSNPEEILFKYFGYASFRFNQKQIIETVLARKDALAILPTGGGKSVCYQIPGLILGGTTLVISPLISLMKDQVDQLKKRNISAAYLNSSLGESEIDDFFTQFTNRKYQFVYIAPERLATSTFLAACKKVEIPLVAIDEAHCISQWGHDFRPEYLQLKVALQSLNQTPTLIALTATATDKVRQDIVTFAGLTNPQIFINSFCRPNLHIICHECKTETEKTLWLLRLWKKYPNQKILLYCGTRAKTAHYAQIATHFGYSCQAYNAGLTPQLRNEIQQAFTSGKLQMIAATNAFGMGVDIPDIRLVVHLQIPQDLEGYYQEIGRGGRDGQESECFLLFSEKDLHIQRNLFAKKYPDPLLLKKALNLLFQENAEQQPVIAKHFLKNLMRQEDQISEEIFFHILHVLESIGYIATQKSHNSLVIKLLHHDAHPLSKWELQRSLKIHQQQSVENFITPEGCRSQSVLKYFGEENTKPCYKCDICLPEQLKISVKEIEGRAGYWKILSKKPYISPNVIKYLALCATSAQKKPGLSSQYAQEITKN